jgi:hypothetical protein
MSREDAPSIHFLLSIVIAEIPLSLETIVCAVVDTCFLWFCVLILKNSPAGQSMPEIESIKRP